MEDLSKKNEALEEFFRSKREKWTALIMPLFPFIKGEPVEIYDMQATALSYRHSLSEEITYFLNKLSKEMVKSKENRKEKFIYYATGFSLKTNNTEKNIMIDSDVAELDRGIEMLQSHIDYLRDCVKTIDNLQYAVKNRIMLMEYLTK